MPDSTLTAARLREVLHYSPDTGVFTWRVSYPRVRPGDVAGSVNGAGYVKMRVDQGHYKAHRLAHLYMVGEWPASLTDHVDLNKANNRWSNLRSATDVENQSNRPRQANNKSGFKGVVARGNKWRARINASGHRHNLGDFATREDAHAAYCRAAAELHGDFARTA